MTAACSVLATRSAWFVCRPGGPVLVVGAGRVALFAGWLAGVWRG